MRLAIICNMNCRNHMFCPHYEGVRFEPFETRYPPACETCDTEFAYHVVRPEDLLMVNEASGRYEWKQSLDAPAATPGDLRKRTTDDR